MVHWLVYSDTRSICFPRLFTHARQRYELRFRLRFFFFLLLFLFLSFGVTLVHANLCQPANFYNYSKKELQRKTFFNKFLAGVELATSESAVQYLIHRATATRLDIALQKLIFNSKPCSQVPTSFPRWRPFSKWSKL